MDRQLSLLAVLSADFGLNWSSEHQGSVAVLHCPSCIGALDCWEGFRPRIQKEEEEEEVKLAHGPTDTSCTAATANTVTCPISCLSQGGEGFQVCKSLLMEALTLLALAAVS